MVLKDSGDDVLFPLTLPKTGSRENRLVICLAAAGGKQDLLRLAAQLPGDLCPCLLEGLVGPLPHGVEAGGVAVLLVEVGQHGRNGLRTHFRGSGVVRIYVHHDEIPFFGRHMGYVSNRGVER